MCPESGLLTAPNWPKIRKMTMTSQFPDMMSSSEFFDVVLFLLSNLVTGSSFMSISSLVLQLWQYSFIKDWPEIWKLEIPLSEFCPIYGDCGKSGIPNLASMSIMKCQGYTVSDSLKLVSAIFIKFLFFHQMKALQKLWKMPFISSKKLFLFPRYSNFCISVLPSFSSCRPLL